MMGGEEKPADGGEAAPADDAEIFRQAAEQLLSECEAKSPRVYVLEMMSILPKKSRQGSGEGRAIACQYSYSMALILALVKRVAVKVWPAPKAAKHGIVNREIAILANPGVMESLGLGGECMWLREIEADELFDTEDSTLLLQPRQAREIVSEFVLDALRTRLCDNWNDARLAVTHAAGELLLNDLEEDICLIPDRFSEVVQAIDEVLSKVDWFSLTEDLVLSLSDDVIRRVPAS